MAVYDLEEQDQLDDLKAWWTQYGNYVTAGVVAICVVIVAIQGWRWWQRSQAEQASVLYSAVSAAAKSNDLGKAKDAAMQLMSRYPGTGYAPRAELIVARLKFENGDKVGAKSDLQWTIDRSSEDELKQIARYRLAEIQFDDKQYDEALRTLDARHDEPFAGLYADLRGDILAAAGRNDDARAAFQTALAKIDAKSSYRNYVEVKLNSLGGPRAATPLTPAAGAPVPATPSAASAPAAPASAPAAPASASAAPAAPASTPAAPASAKAAPAPAPAAPK